MARVPISLALSNYDRHMPFVEGSVGVEGVDLTVLEVGQSVEGRHGQDRHRRMLDGGEFDAAEISFSNYIMALDRGKPFTAIPIIPRRLFSQSLFFTRIDSPLRGPEALVGKRVGLNTYQTTLSVLAKGDLQHAHGVPWKAITWVINLPEIIPFDPPADVRVEWLEPRSRRIDQLLLDGELDALVMPHPPRAMMEGAPKVRRLFADARAAELAYYQQQGYWPIMHYIVFRNDVVERHPWLPRAMYDAFLQAKDKVADYYSDPNWSSLVWAPYYREEEAGLIGDPWTHGLAANRVNISRFMAYSHEQGLTSGSLTPEQLFHPSVLDT
jgi:4,5-dihydroxyphthalate decarboxylase